MASGVDPAKERMMTMDRKEGQTLFEVTPEISHFAELCEKNNAIDKELYTKYEVKRGLRDLNGKVSLRDLRTFPMYVRRRS